MKDSISSGLRRWSMVLSAALRSGLTIISLMRWLLKACAFDVGDVFAFIFPQALNVNASSVNMAGRSHKAAGVALVCRDGFNALALYFFMLNCVWF